MQPRGKMLTIDVEFMLFSISVVIKRFFFPSPSPKGNNKFSENIIKNELEKF